MKSISNHLILKAKPIHSTIKIRLQKLVPSLTIHFLKKLKRITKQLLEDRMLEDFRRDVRKAKFLSTGELVIGNSFAKGTDSFIEP